MVRIKVHLYYDTVTRSGAHGTLQPICIATIHGTDLTSHVHLGAQFHTVGDLIRALAESLGASPKLIELSGMEPADDN